MSQRYIVFYLTERYVSLPNHAVCSKAASIISFMAVAIRYLYLRGMSPDELKDYFASKELPDTLQLWPGTQIADMQGFLGTSFAVVKTYKGNISECPAWWRLMWLYEIVSKEAK